MDFSTYAPQIIQTEIDGTKATCIVLGDSNTHLPGHLLQGKNPTSFYLKDNLVHALPWEGISMVDGKQCLRLPSLPLYPVWELAGRHQGEALAFVRDLIHLIEQMDDAYLSLESGTIPMWRIYGLEGGGVFLLPPALSSAVEACMDEKSREANFNAWVHYDLHRPYTLIDQMAQILYFAATKTVPLESDDSREDHCTILPLSLWNTNLDPSLSQLIDHILHMGLTEQRDLTGNKAPQQALAWLDEQLSSVSWPASVGTNPNAEEMETFRQKQHRRAAHRRFWRKRGWLVVTITAVVLAVGYFVGSRIKENLTPPYTYGMSDEEIIREYYAGQSELDVQKLEASLAPHVKSPAEMEVMNLYVNRQTRMAYENITAIINVNDWIADGKPAIGSSQGVYGVTDVQIQQSGEDAYLVTSTIYTPFPYDDEDENTAPSDDSHTLAFVYQQTQTFTFTTNKRGWRLISGIANVEYHKTGVIEIPTKPDKPKREVPGQDSGGSGTTQSN